MCKSKMSLDTAFPIRLLCALSENSDQPAHPGQLINHRCSVEDALDPMI